MQSAHAIHTLSAGALRTYENALLVVVVVVVFAVPVPVVVPVFDVAVDVVDVF